MLPPLQDHDAAELARLAQLLVQCRQAQLQLLMPAALSLALPQTEWGEVQEEARQALQTMAAAAGQLSNNSQAAWQALAGAAESALRRSRGAEAAVPAQQAALAAQRRQLAGAVAAAQAGGDMRAHCLQVGHLAGQLPQHHAQCASIACWV